MLSIISNMLSEIKKKDTSLRNLKKYTHRTYWNRVEKCLPGPEGWGNRERLVTVYKLSAVNWIRSEELTYNMLTIVDNNGIIIGTY